MDNIVSSILLSKSRREVLKYLHACDTDITGRELARRIGFSHQQTHNALRQLISFGIVERRIFGPAHLFRLNRQNQLTAELHRRQGTLMIDHAGEI